LYAILKKEPKGVPLGKGLLQLAVLHDFKRQVTILVRNPLLGFEIIINNIKQLLKISHLNLF